MAYFNEKHRRPAAKQNFSEGETVKIGFVDGLEVIKKIATPGDYRPDFYVLWQSATNRFYAFQPHFGLTRCATLSEAMRALA
jgi:hypothetical protein